MSKIKFKKGAASIYVVAFTTMVMGIIAVSFVRVMVSETIQTTNYDLSQSAYDSALAGVEDAKVALIKYHDCLSQGYTRGDTDGCPKIIKEMQDGIGAKSCDTVARTLGRAQESSGEVMIQETKQTSTNNVKFMDQAYTCVTIEEELNDYRAYLDSNNRTRLIPVRTTGSYSAIKGVYFQWYSENNGSANKYMSNNKLMKNSNSSSWNPPVVTLDIIQTDQSFKLGELSVNNGTNNGTDHSMLVFYPVKNGGTRKLEISDVLNASDKNNNSPIQVDCSGATSADGFYCRTYIALPDTYKGNQNRNDDSFFFRVTLPYGQPATDFSITLCTNDGCSQKIENGSTDNTKTFTAVQARVDSTGRANDLYRRVETRVELVDTGFPYPEFTIEVSDSLDKSFWVTKNCWTMDNNSGGGCDNSGEV